jgi:hypothetical protein
MRAIWTLARFTVAFLLVGSPALATGLTPSATRIAIHVEQGDWGAARTQDIETVLTSVADVLVPYFPQRASSRVLVASSRQSPRILLEKSPDGAHLVLLNVQDTRWDQFAYQFSHELCHLFANSAHREMSGGVVARDHQWFEEALCEAVSLFTLKQLASSWEHSPPHPHWKDYAPAFREYAERLLSEKHRHLPLDKSVAGWYAENREVLGSNPYLREKNEFLATQLIALLEKAPGSLGAIGYLNLEKSSFSKSFEAYLESWYSCCPEEIRDFARWVISLFTRSDHDGTAVASVTVPGGPPY